MDCQVRGVNVHYEDVASGRPLLVLHEWASDGRTEMYVTANAVEQDLVTGHAPG